MKVCLKGNQTREYLQKADEILISIYDMDRIPKLFENYPAINVIITLPHEAENIDIDWKMLDAYNQMFNYRIILCVSDESQALRAKDYNIRFYFRYAIESFYELLRVRDMEPSYVILGPELFFRLPDVKNIGIPVRAFPNVALPEYSLAKDDGVLGTWIRPEDLEAYSEYIDAIEFYNADVHKEQALYRIYIEQKEWPGDLSMIIENFDYPGVNRMLKSEYTQKRISCGQRCATRPGSCQICYRVLNLANPTLIQNYAEEVQKKIIEK